MRINAFFTVRALKPLCATRWTVRGKAVRNTIDQYEAVVEALEEMAAGSSNVATRAGGLLVRFQKGITLLALYMALTVIEPLEILNTGLQARENTVAGMMKAVDVLKNSLARLRREEDFAILFKRAEDRAKELDLEEIVAPRVRRPPKRFAGTGAIFSAESPEQHFRMEFFKIIDTALMQLSSRIEQDGIQSYVKLEQCLLTGEVSDVCSAYPELNVPLLRIQLPMFRQQFKFTSTDEAATVMRSIVVEVRNLFGQVEVLLRLLLVVPATSCEAERSFSALRRLKTWLRSTMSQRRLNSVAVCHVHHAYIDEIDIRTVVDDFVRGVDRRVQLFGKF